MPHISQNKLPKKNLDQIYTQLLNSFQKAFSKKDSSSFNIEFFTKTERIMFAKRLAIISMLENKIPPYHISQALKVSPSTVARISLKMEIGKLDTVLSIIKKERVNILGIIETILSAGLPPRVGKGRWKKIYKTIT